MIDDLRPYPGYHTPGQLSLGKVPGHWNVVRIKRTLREVDARSEDGSEPLLSLSRTRGLIRQSELTSKATTAATLQGYKLYKPGQIVMNRMQAWSGMFGVGSELGIVSPDYAVFEAAPDADPTYLLHLLRSPAMVSQFAINSRGIGTGFNRLYTEDFGAICMPLPPPAEQATIVRFLAALDRRVNRFVRAKRRLIELLTEQKQALITHAVTRGLDPSAKSKPSGIDWLGDVPEGWKVVQLRRLVQVGRHITYGIVQPGPYVDGGRPMVRAQDYSFGWAERRSVYHVSPEIEEPYRRSRLKARDIIYTIVGQGSVGNVAIVPPEFEGANITQTTARISIDDQLASPEFVFAVLSSLIGERQLRSYVKGVGQPGINLGHLKLYWIPLPPREQQSRIVQHLSTATASADGAIRTAEREIALIREYRTRLVADVVTGKLDVRAAAAKLLDEEADTTEPTGALQEDGVDIGEDSEDSEQAEELEEADA